MNVKDNTKRSLAHPSRGTQRATQQHVDRSDDVTSATTAATLYSTTWKRRLLFKNTPAHCDIEFGEEPAPISTTLKKVRAIAYVISCRAEFFIGWCCVTVHISAWDGIDQS